MAAIGRQGEGPVRISDEVIAVCAANAALKTEGVVNLSGGISNALSKNFLGKELNSKGVKSKSDRCRRGNRRPYNSQIQY